MSMYGDDDYCNEKNYLYDEITRFLKTHPISELLSIVSNVIEYEKEHDGIIDAINSRR